nr:GGDEF domain-containing protein [Lachnospiraceae bacterium]
MSNKKQIGLLFKFSIFFLLFTTAMLIMMGVTTFFNQTNASLDEAKDRLQFIARQMKEMILGESDNFRVYQEYFKDHADEIRIPKSFHDDYDYRSAKRDYERLFAEKYPGKILHEDIAFDELSDEVKLAFITYQQEYWMSVFYNARNIYEINYICYIFPQGENLHMTWMIDGPEDFQEIDGKSYYVIGFNCPENPEDGHYEMWRAVETKSESKEFDVNDNMYGRTYVYYVPLVLDGKFMGLIGTEISIDKVDSEILALTLKQLGVFAVIMGGVMAILLVIIHRTFIRKLVKLRNDVGIYAQDKNAGIATVIEMDGAGNDEISALSMQISAMIMEIENHVNMLLETTNELKETKEAAKELDTLARMDALTGIKNKKAYDEATEKLEWEIAEGKAEFGIVMVDMNYLKRINDLYGHDKGNLAIKKLCSHVCHIFKHSPVFRVGGDEFVIILKGEDLKNYDSLKASFYNTINEWRRDQRLSEWEKVSAAM